MREITYGRLKALIDRCRSTLLGVERTNEIVFYHTEIVHRNTLKGKRRAVWAALHNEIGHHNDHRDGRRRHSKHRWTVK